ncbi:MAG TPA: hypothetical protein VFH83_12700, partial [Spirochaetia bacterium]|nr:hypothetical protein [Spirochaetia bacterium]
GLGRQASGMWAEMLYNRSFRPVSPARPIVWEWLRLDPEHYDARAPFWHSGYEEMDWEPIGDPPFRTLGFEPFKGNDSLGIRNSTPGTEAGIRQRGVSLSRGSGYRLRFLGGFAGRKTAAETREVRIRVTGESSPQRVIAEHTVGVSANQEEHGFELSTGDFSGRAVVSFSFTWEGILHLSWASLTPVETVLGWRKDVVDLLRRVSPPILRFPGGCFASFYDWRDGIGPRSSRSPREPYFWGGLEENDIGIDEYLDLCAELGSEPQLCVNLMTGTPQAAADLVEYCNGPDDSRMGRLRRELGVTRKQTVRFWEMDNEAGRKWSALQYAAKVVEFSRRMREVDPTITVMMEYYSWTPDWLPRMLELAGKHIDVVIHRDGDRTFMAKALATLTDYNQRNGTSIRQANTEWLADFDSPEPFEDPEIPKTYDWEPSGNDYRKVLSYRQVRWFYALNAASRVLDYISYGGEFALANFNNCVNTWGGNIINASKEGAWLSPAGRVFELFRDFPGGYPLVTTVEPLDRPELNVQACERSAPSGASAMGAERTVDLYAVNRGTQPISLSLRLPPGIRPRRARVLDAETRLATNILGEDRIRYRETDGRALPELSPLSVTHLVLG